MFLFVNYILSIDMWFVGCIFVEFFGGKFIFKGEDYVDQLNKIFNFFGIFIEDIFWRVGFFRVQDYIRSLFIKLCVKFGMLYFNVFFLVLDLLSKLLIFDFVKRYGCEEVLEYLQYVFIVLEIFVCIQFMMVISFVVWYDFVDEFFCEVFFDFFFEEEDFVSGMRDLIFEEVRSF